MVYRLFRVAIDSDISLPQLSAIDSGVTPELKIRFRVDRSTGNPGEPAEVLYSVATPQGCPWILIARTDQGYLVRETGYADFTIDRRGENITCFPANPSVSDTTVGHLLVDWVLPLVLSLRGENLLHASSVLTPYGVLAFVGPSGVGKSTFAASFLHAGYDVVGDDCLLVDFDRLSKTYVCMPPLTGIRLWTDSLEHLNLPDSGRPAIADSIPKRWLDSFWTGRRLDSTQLLPLQALYLLERDAEASEPKLVTPSRRHGLMKLLSCSWTLDTGDKLGLTQRFRFFAELTNRVEIKLLKLPSNFAKIPTARELILSNLGETDLRQLRPPYLS